MKAEIRKTEFRLGIGRNTKSYFTAYRLFQLWVRSRGVTLISASAVPHYESKQVDLWGLDGCRPKCYVFYMTSTHSRTVLVHLVVCDGSACCCLIPLLVQLLHLAGTMELSVPLFAGGGDLKPEVSTVK